MVRISKTMQPKHLETLSPWLKEFCETACSTPLPLLPNHLETFPTRWPFPRGDLYHWILLLNRFDEVLEKFCNAYKLNEGPQTVQFSNLILGAEIDGSSTGLPSHPEGDLHLVESILAFSRMLLRNCGNRSLYASSSHLNNLLNSTSLSLLLSTLLLGSELAQRYQAAVKRLHMHIPKHSQAALLSHYNIDLDRVTQLALPFAKTPVTEPEIFQATTPSTSTPSNKGKEKAYASMGLSKPSTSAPTYATDFVSMVKGSVPSTVDGKQQASVESSALAESRWEEWGDVKFTYYPKANAEDAPGGIGSGTPRAPSTISSSSVPVTPTPIRRSSNLGPHGPRASKGSGADDSPTTTPRRAEDISSSNIKTVEISYAKLQKEGVHSILSHHSSMAPELQYQLLTKLRVASALTASLEMRQQLLAVRLMAITNLAYIHPESTFLEKVLKQDNDEPRRFQLTYQLAELIHPPAEGDIAVPRHLQAIVLSTLDALAQHQSKYQDVCAALNTNVNHGILLYVVRTAVAEMSSEADIIGDRLTHNDEWRDSLFALISTIGGNPRTGSDLVTAGLIPILVDVLTLRNAAGKRYQPKVLNFLDNSMFSARDAFQTLVDADGLDMVSKLIVYEVSTATEEVATGNGTQRQHRSAIVDYQIPYLQQTTLKWLFKFIHHMMTSAGTYGANSDRLLRNLIDSSQLLASLRQIISNGPVFGSVVWTNAVNILNDFINNEPTSFAVIAEAGLSKALLESVTGREIQLPSSGAPSTGADHAAIDGEDSVEPSQGPTNEEEDGSETQPSVTPERPTLAELQIPRDPALLARGIMPTPETISIIPHAFGAICLNNAGMNMFQECGALESFFEIFESPEHIKCMSNNKELPSSLGSIFDELVRHHPPLKKAIINAILNMVTRVSFLCQRKEKQHKVGAKLWTRNAASSIVAADGDLIHEPHLEIAAPTEDKGKAPAAASDIEMKDAGAEAANPSASDLDTNPKDAMTPYIIAVANFLSTMFTNSSIRSDFCSSEGAIDFILDLTDSPCLSHDFPDSSASRALRTVISQLTETKAHLTLPSLLRRAQAAVDVLEPFASFQGDGPFFKAFINQEAREQTDTAFIAQGTSFVKALVSLFSVVSSIHECYLASSFQNHRSQTPGLNQLNLGDYYVRLVQCLGRLLGASSRELTSFDNVVPESYKPNSRGKDSIQPPLPQNVLEGDVQSLLPASHPEPASNTSVPTKEDMETPEYKNLQVLSILLKRMPHTFGTFFQILGRGLVNKRAASDAFQKQSHAFVAGALADTVLLELEPRGPESSIQTSTNWVNALAGLKQMLIDQSNHNERPVQTITLVLQAFKDRGGFDVLNHILEIFAEKVSHPIEGETEKYHGCTHSQLAVWGTTTILDIYKDLVVGKNVTDALQTISMSSRERGDSRTAHWFSAPQFLVELRMSILPVLRRLWNSDLVEKAPSHLIKGLIQTIRSIATADNESGAQKRSDKAINVVKRATQKFKISSDHLSHITSHHQYSKELAEEALYRCNNNLAWALEYCRDLTTEGRPRYPAPAADISPPEATVSSRPTTSNSEQSADSVGGTDVQITTEVLTDDTVSDSDQDSQMHSKKITVDDLETERAAIRENLIDKCLDVINAHGDVTFEIAGLIRTVVLKAPDSGTQLKIVAETLVLALMSFAGDDDIRASGKKVAAYAHLLALLLQNKDFYHAAVGELQENLSTLIEFVKLPSDHKDNEPSPWIAHILLIIELLLSQDAKPRKTKWTAPKDESDKIEQPVLESVEPAVPLEDREHLLSSIMEILHHVGKDEALALSVLRVLVTLTRTRKVALVMGEKKNIQRLLLMAKQLSGATASRSPSIQGPMMVILRHIIEDEETVKQIIRSEIKSFFEDRRHSRSVGSTSAYIAALPHAIVRSPEVFVEITNEMVKYGRWSYHTSENSSRAPHLVLKESGQAASDNVSKSSEDTVQPTVQATEDLSIQDLKPSTEDVDTDMPDPVKAVQEVKAPIVENPDGVIHHLLSELLKYKDVHDVHETDQGQASGTTKPDSPVSPNGDVLMSEPSPGLTEEAAVAVEAPKPPTKPEFNAEDHPIYIYRCFLLQCLTELLGSYNRTKIEFINFKRNALPQTMTPSKPRSSVVNYLLYDLVPLGTMDHTAAIAFHKRLTTSHWADSVITALLSKTGEHLPRKDQELFNGDDEPDLLFVRRFVLDHILKAFKEATVSTEPLDQKYARMYSLSELMVHLMGGKEHTGSTNGSVAQASQKQLRRLMFDKGFISALTASIADVDLNFPNAKRAVKHILRPLKLLTNTAITLSELALITAPPGQHEEDEIESADSVSDAEDEREETPDLFRNSTLGMFEPGREEETSSESEEDDDEEMYEDGYGDEMDYDEEPEDAEDNISEEDEIEGMGPIEGLSGDVEVIMDDDEDEEDDDDDEDDEESAEEDSAEEHESDEDRVVIVDGGPLQVGADDEMEMDMDMDMDEWEDEHDHEDDDEEEIDYEGQAQDEDEASLDNLGPLGDLIQAFSPRGPNGVGTPIEVLQRMNEQMAAEEEAERLEEELDNEEDMMAEQFGAEDDDEEEDDDDGEHDMDDEEMFLGNGFTGGHPPFGWDPDAGSPVLITRGHHRATRQAIPPGFPGMWPRDAIPEFARPHRSHRPGQPPHDTGDDGINPLLRDRSATRTEGTTRRGPFAFSVPGNTGLDLMDLTRAGGGIGTSATAALFDMIRTLPDMPSFARNGGLQFTISSPGEHLPREFRAMFSSLQRGQPGTHTHGSHRDPFEPMSAVFFTPQSTSARWLEEAKLLFGSTDVPSVALTIKPALEAVLVPPAVEADKAQKATEAEQRRKLEEEVKKRQEEERIKQEAEEKAQREAKEEADRAAEERAAAEALASMPEGGTQSLNDADTNSDAMEGVEDDHSAEDESAPAETVAEDRPRITTMIRGNPFDITDLGVDPTFLAELPEDLREEVIMNAVAERRSQAAATGAQPSEIDQEFLDALPEDIRDEIMQQERQDRRRREREEQRRTAAAAAGNAAPEVEDPGSFIRDLAPGLRHQILMEQDEDMLSLLPRDVADEARLAQQSQQARVAASGPSRAARQYPFGGSDNVPPPNVPRPQRRPIVQMLDKSGIATLLRMMFTFQHQGLRNALNPVLENVALNRQNRIEVLSTLLNILQDGSADMPAVERSFAHLSLRAKQPKENSNQKTPQPLKRTFTGMSGSVSLTQTSSEASPLMVVQQCLGVLAHLTRGNPHIPQYFLTEQESQNTLKRSLSKKGKGKENKAAKYAINSLLGLLDRDLIMENSSVMELLSTLLSALTSPLQNFNRKPKEVEENKKTDVPLIEPAVVEPTVSEVAPSTSTDATVSDTAPGSPNLIELETSTVSVVDRSASIVTPPTVTEGEPASVEATEPSAEISTAKEEPEKQSRKSGQSPPVIPEQNLQLVIKIFVARECSSRTFRETLSTIKNLSAIPGAKSIFGRELISKAQGLGETILVDLQELLPQIQKAATGTEIQGVALAKFSPGGSDQNKLLRVLTALDHLFDPKRDKKDVPGGSEVEGDSSSQITEKQDLLASLYENSTFGPMWEKLSSCLSAIRQREHMLSVATILLPLIESLMVVCKNTTSKEISKGHVAKEMSLNSPDPESRMDSLFFSFTEEHRKILNELVRHSPKLMSGTFSLLVKNPKVLEFDNKRNYFSRSIHSKSSTTRQTFPPLQLSVRRDQVFHDSFKSLWFQTPDQMKFGKLNIRFHGEDGVDAGGVTREWFQVLSRQMFDPGYALFIPVSSDRTTFHPNQLSSINEEHLMFFKFIGRIIGKALYENRVLDCHFSRAVYKRILGKAVSLKDMESLDPEYYKSLVWMLENDITDIITETFSVDNDKFGVVETIDFIENGRNIAVTEENKSEYVRLMVEFKLTGSVSKQLDEFLQGFHDIIPAELVAIFNEQELELLISGLPEIDVDDWKSHTEYQGYTASSPQIQWFWRAVRSFDKEERAKLLQFVTGTSKVPLNGFGELEGMNGFSRFNIHRDPTNKERLPSSHTCFNQFDLPEYDSYESLRSHVLTAITAGSSYFGFA